MTALTIVTMKILINGDIHGDEEDNDDMYDDDNIDNDDEGSDNDVICDDNYSLLPRHMPQTSKPRMRCKYARRHLCFHIPSGSDCRRWTGLEQNIAGEPSLKQSSGVHTYLIHYWRWS